MNKNNSRKSPQLSLTDRINVTIAFKSADGQTQESQGDENSAVPKIQENN